MAVVSLLVFKIKFALLLFKWVFKVFYDLATIGDHCFEEIAWLKLAVEICKVSFYCHRQNIFLKLL